MLIRIDFLTEFTKSGKMELIVPQWEPKNFRALFFCTWIILAKIAANKCGHLQKFVLLGDNRDFQFQNFISIC